MKIEKECYAILANGDRWISFLDNLVLEGEKITFAELIDDYNIACWIKSCLCSKELSCGNSKGYNDTELQIVKINLSYEIGEGKYESEI